MARDPAEGVFRQYKGLIWYAANMYGSHSPIIDLEDLFQDGCLMMLEFFDGRADTTDNRIHNTFKKSLFLWMRRMVKRRIRQARPCGKVVVRLNGEGRVYQVRQGYEGDNEEQAIDIDRMLATVDTCVLMKLYAREFVAELRCLLKGLDLTIFELMVRSASNGDTRQDVVRKVVTETDICVSGVYDHIVKIRDMAAEILLRPA